MIYLNLVIISISLNNMQSWLLAERLVQHKFWLDYLQLPWHFLSAPFLYSFVVHYLKIDKKFPNILRIIIPFFILISIAQLTFVFWTSNNNSNTHRELDLLYEKYTSLEEFISFFASIGIFVYTYYILIKKQKLFSNILSYNNLKWLHNFFKFSFLGYTLWISALVLKVIYKFANINSYYPLRVFTTIIILWLGYQAFLQLRIIKERKEIRKITQAKEEVTATGTQKSEEKFTQINTFITENRKYLQAKYTLQNLSEDTNLSPSSLSAIINNAANKSFVDYINEMRIKQAKKLLVNPEYKNYTIVAIGLESGFNSKSSFYNVFKKHTGCTPLAYKNSCDC